MAWPVDPPQAVLTAASCRYTRPRFPCHAAILAPLRCHSTPTAIRLFVTLRGPEPPERYDDLVGAVNRHCPVLDIASNPVPVEREVKIA